MERAYRNLGTMSTRLCCFASSLTIVRPLAIRYKNYRLHRVPGWLSNALIPFVLISSVARLWNIMSI
jgi:hypothetical protein